MHSQKKYEELLGILKSIHKRINNFIDEFKKEIQFEEPENIRILAMSIYFKASAI